MVVIINEAHHHLTFTFIHAYRNVTFYLEFFQFTQPTPITDFSPNGVELTISTDLGFSWDPVAYYVPIANTMWANFSTSYSTIVLSSGQSLPVLAPSVTQFTWAAACISSSSTEVMIRWKQAGFVGCNDKWVLGSIHVNTPSQEHCLNYTGDEHWEEGE